MDRIWRRHRKLRIFDEEYILCHERRIDAFRDYYYETFVCTIHPTDPIIVTELSFKTTNSTDMYLEIIAKLNEYSNGNYQIGEDID